LSQTTEHTSELYYQQSQCEKFDQNIDELVNDPNYKDHNKKKTEFYRDWAKALERRLELGEEIEGLEEVKDISGYIRDIKAKKGYSVFELDYVSHHLAEKYKRVYIKLSGDSFENLQQRGRKTAINQLYEEAKDPETFRKNYNAAKAELNHREFVADQCGIAIVDHKEKTPVISTDLPIPGKSETYYAAYEVAESLEAFKKNWDGVVKKLQEFPIKDKKADRRSARFLRSFVNLVDGYGRLLPSCKDEKYAFTLYKWFEVVANEEAWGKHAAAVKAKIKPVGETIKKLRPLTRERVGDAKQRYWADMQAFGKAMNVHALFIGLVEWRDNYGEMTQRGADRRNRLSPTLSETAFGADNIS